MEDIGCGFKSPKYELTISDGDVIQGTTYFAKRWITFGDDSKVG